MNQITLRKAERKQSKLRIGFSGPSGSGKTYSALLVGFGITGDWSKVALIDTESGSGELYSDLGEYNVISLDAPFTPERYIEAIEACENAGMEVIIIDSISHEWDGKGGCLESNELLGQTKFKGNNWAAWSVTTPRHQKFIQKIISSTAHVLTTARSKTDTIQTDDKKIKKVGTKEIQREGFEYELTLNFNIDRDGHYAIASKDRTGIYSENDPFIITSEVGKTLIAWVGQAKELPPVQDETLKLKGKIVHLLKLYGEKPTNTGEFEKTVYFLTDLKLIPENYEEIISRLKIKVQEMPQVEEENSNIGTEEEPTLAPAEESKTEAKPRSEERGKGRRRGISAWRGKTKR